MRLGWVKITGAQRRGQSTRRTIVWSAISCPALYQSVI